MSHRTLPSIDVKRPAPASHAWDDSDYVVIDVGGAALAIELFDRPGPARVPMGATTTGRPLYIKAEVGPPAADAVRPPEPGPADTGPGGSAWDDSDEVKVRLPGGRTFSVSAFLSAAPGRLPAGATLLGKPLYIAVAELAS